MRRQSEKKEERYDLFSSLLDACADEEGDDDESVLSPSELIGVCAFIYDVSANVTDVLFV